MLLTGECLPHLQNHCVLSLPALGIWRSQRCQKQCGYPSGLQSPGRIGFWFASGLKPRINVSVRRDISFLDVCKAKKQRRSHSHIQPFERSEKKIDLVSVFLSIKSGLFSVRIRFLCLSKIFVKVQLLPLQNHLNENPPEF